MVTDSSGKSATKGTSKTDSVSDSTGTAASDGTSDAVSDGKERSAAKQTSTSNMSTKQLPLAYETVNQVSRYRDADDTASPVKTRIDTENTKSIPTKWNGSDFVGLAAGDVNLESQKMDSTGTSDTTSNSTTNSTVKTTSKSTTTNSAKTTGTQTQDSTSDSTSDQKSVTLLTEYRHPAIENDMRWLQRELELQDEFLSQRIFALQIPHMSTILANELDSIDQEVRQLQLNLIHSYLTSPVSGLVTAVYKDVGESVAAGEPVIRVEDDSEILLVGVINCRSAIRVGDSVRLNIDNPYEAGGAPIRLDGKLVVVRGHSSDNDEWEVLIRCDNRVPGDLSERMLPLNYSFQREDVQMQVG
jgi:hypothetical protein